MARCPSRATHCRSSPELVRLLGGRHVRQLLFGEQARLDAHRELDLFGRVQQRHLADLLQVVLDRVGGRTRDHRRVDRDVVLVGRRDDDRTRRQRLAEARACRLVLVVVLVRRPRRGRVGLLAPATAAGGSSRRRRSSDIVEFDVVVELVLVVVSSESLAIAALALGAFVALRRRRLRRGALGCGGLLGHGLLTGVSASVSFAPGSRFRVCSKSRFAFHRRARPSALRSVSDTSKTLVKSTALRGNLGTALTMGQIIYCLTLAALAMAAEHLTATSEGVGHSRQGRLSSSPNGREARNRSSSAASSSALGRSPVWMIGVARVEPAM